MHQIVHKQVLMYGCLLRTVTTLTTYIVYTEYSIIIKQIVFNFPTYKLQALTKHWIYDVILSIIFLK